MKETKKILCHFSFYDQIRIQEKLEEMADPNRERDPFEGETNVNRATGKQRTRSTFDLYFRKLETNVQTEQNNNYDTHMYMFLLLVRQK